MLDFGLYRERTGAAIVIGKNSEHVGSAEVSFLRWLVQLTRCRLICSAALVKTILQNQELTKIWKQELSEIQQRLLNLRQSLCDELRNTYNTSQFDFIESHKGMFGILGFEKLK